MDVVRDVLDKKAIDRNGREIGRVDRILLHKVWGLLAFTLIMAGIFMAIFFAATPLMDATEAGIKWLGETVAAKMADGTLKDLWKDGIVAGVGGGLSPDLAAGELVVASEVRGGGTVAESPSAPLLAGALRRLGLPVRVGPVLSSPRVVKGLPGALAADMESAWLAPDGDDPFAVVRAVVDTPGHPLWSLGTPVRGVRALRALGGDPAWELPSRFDEGYGLSRAAVERLARRGTGLLVTVDCGVTAVEQVAAARAAGLDVVVTDHHRPGPVLPDCPLVHPAPPDGEAGAGTEDDVPGSVGTREIEGRGSVGTMPVGGGGTIEVGASPLSVPPGSPGTGLPTDGADGADGAGSGSGSGGEPAGGS